MPSNAREGIAQACNEAASLVLSGEWDFDRLFKSLELLMNPLWGAHLVANGATLADVSLYYAELGQAISAIEAQALPVIVALNLYQAAAAITP